MKKLYKCEGCGDLHDYEDKALACEAHGVGREIVPKGTIISLHGYKDMVFAIAGGRASGHYCDYFFWACRDTDVGDSLGEEKCGAEFLTDLDFLIAGKTTPFLDRDGAKRTAQFHRVSVPLRKSKAFNRMVKWLKKNKMKPAFWDGEKIVKIK